VSTNSTVINFLAFLTWYAIIRLRRANMTKGKSKAMKRRAIRRADKRQGEFAQTKSLGKLAGRYGWGCGRV
jgi:hypothetical protein